MEQHDLVSPVDSAGAQPVFTDTMNRASASGDSFHGWMSTTASTNVRMTGHGSHSDGKLSSATMTPLKVLMNLPFIRRTKSTSTFPRYHISVDEIVEKRAVQAVFGAVSDNSKELNLTHSMTNGSSGSSEKQGQTNGDVPKGSTPNGTTPNGDNPNGGTPSGGTPNGSSEGLQPPDVAEEECEEYPLCPPPTPVEPDEQPENFSNGFFEIKSSLLAGFGAFALKNLRWGQTILVEKALFHADRQTLFDELDRLTPSLKQAYYRMHAHAHWLWPHQGRTFSIFATNSFNTSQLGPCRNSVFLTAARFNHACKTRNNVAYVYDRHRDVIIFSTNRDVQSGEELTIDYGKGPVELYVEYGFMCRCGGCTPLTDAQLASLKNPIRW